MLYRYAILPDVFRSELYERRPSAQKDVKQLLRGLCENGLLTDLHNGGWGKHLRETLLPKLPPQLQADIQACLVQLQKTNRLVTSTPYQEGNPACGTDWIHAAMEVHHQNALQGIVLSQGLLKQYGLPHPPLLELSEALDAPQWLERRRSQTVSMSLPDYEKALRPLLGYAKTLYLVDPYMTCQYRTYSEVIRMCARLMGHCLYPKSSRRIQIHTRNKNTETSADQLSSWRQFLQPLAEASLGFKVFLWSAKQEDLHDRFILTNQCGISVPRGLDIRQAATTWSLLEDEDRRLQIERYIAASSPFKLEGCIEVSNLTVSK